MIDEFGVKYSADGKTLIKCTDKKILRYIIKEGTETIKKEAFYQCNLLGKIEFPSTLKVIGKDAFVNCKLKSLKLPISLREIKDGAFAFNELRSVKLNNGLTTLGVGVFDYCKFLQEIEISETVVTIKGHIARKCEYGHANIICKSPAFNWIDNILYTADMKKVVMARNMWITKYTVNLPEKVRRICSNAFADAPNVEFLNLPDKLTKLEEGTFAIRNTTKNFLIPPKITHLPVGSVCDCFEELIIPKTIKKLDNGFCGYNKLKKLTVPNNAGYDPSSMYRPWDISIDNGDGTTTYTNWKQYFGSTSVEKIVIPEGVTELYPNAFSNWFNLKEVILPTTLKKIGEYCFEHCENLRHIVIPSSVTEIEACAFRSCLALEKIELNEGLKSIKWSAFSFSGLKSVDIPTTVEFIAKEAFAWCKQLDNVKLPPKADIAEDAFKKNLY